MGLHHQPCRDWGRGQSSDTLVSFFVQDVSSTLKLVNIVHLKKNLKIATTDIFEDFIPDAREYPGSVTFLGGEILQIY